MCAVLLAAFAVLLALAAASPARADIFTITGIEIEATATTAIEAKQEAIANGQVRAFSELLRKLTRPEDAPRLPPVDATILQQVVIGFSLDNERTGPTQYLADLTVRFHPDAVELLLAESGVELAVTQAPPTLLIPVYAAAEQVILFEGPTPWRETLRRSGLDNRLVPMLLPLGDATDAAVDRDALLAADEGALAQLMVRYDVEFAIVITAVYNAEQAVLAGRAEGIAPSGPIRLDRQVDVVPGEDQAALKALAAALLDAVDEEWRIASTAGTGLVAATRAEEFAFVVPFRDLQDWVLVRERLETMVGVERLDVQSLAAGQANVVISFAGDLNAFLIGLDGLGFAMYDTGAYWELGLR